MTGTERKRLWRERNPQRSREAERARAQARRDRTCASSESYSRYEGTARRQILRVIAGHRWRTNHGAGLAL